MLDWRYGDPITAICVGNKGVMTGSSMGRILYYDIKNKK